MTWTCRQRRRLLRVYGAQDTIDPGFRVHTEEQYEANKLTAQDLLCGLSQLINRIEHITKT